MTATQLREAAQAIADEQPVIVTHANLAAALVAALAELTMVQTGRKVDFTTKDGVRVSYDYADLGDVVKLTRPPLAKHGLVALTPVHAHGNGLACSVTLLHTSGERLDFEPFPFPHGRDAQATGSMVTYHRRYALVAALGMAAGDDDDGAKAQARQPEPPSDPRVSKRNADLLIEKCEAAGLVAAEVVKLGTQGRTSDPYEVHKTEVAAVREALDNLAPAEPAEGES